MQLKNVTLELSAKAFQDNSETAMYSVCRKMFTQYRRLTDQADRISIMLWIADGSEILSYSGDLKQTFEWAYHIGCANPIPTENPSNRKLRDTHCFPAKYRDNIELRSYSWLKRLIEIIRETGKEITNSPIRIGAIFDNGPEFAVSDFKFKTHREIAQGHTLYANSFVTCNSVLHADANRYAGFPGGILEGTTLGTFLGVQYKAFARDLNYDYIWLSNGMGFGTETWKTTGVLYDGIEFKQEKAEEAAEELLRFWRDFRTAAPDAVIETRGSNFSAGIEIASDGAPLKEIYRDFNIAPPVNSPWAALNYNSGLELSAWMSHVAELPGDYFPYRFYIHDPWFLNSPWLDRYGRSPWDIYQPLSIARIDQNGQIQTPNSVALLTVDDSYGNLPDQVPDEVIPHLLCALREMPDQTAPLLWLYPFDEYNQRRNLKQTFNEDLFLGEALQQGLPLNTVVSTTNFRKTHCRAEIIIAPVTAVESCMDELIKRDGKLLIYGSPENASKQLSDLLKNDHVRLVQSSVENAGKMREALSFWGWKIDFDAFSLDSPLPRTTLSRHDNAFIYTVFAIDTTIDMYMNTPLGAPILSELSTLLHNGDAIYRPGKCLHTQCRCFVKQQEDSVIFAKIQFPAYPGYIGRLNYSGLKNAEVRFFPPRGAEDTIEAINGSGELYFLSENILPLSWEDTPFGPCVVLKNISGHLNFAW
ncbi:MAG: hypothetical protein LBM70_05045 [Victivallales bacterium]|jgi:hypothetical protein|nr:hypothetical protein [Victivallales bacterium]